MKRLFTILTILAVMGLSCGFTDFADTVYAYADEISGVITAESVSLEYAETTYNGKKQTPEVTVKIGDKTLVKGTDYTLTLPKDAVNAGDKVITVVGKGAYSGKAEAGYRINPLNCGNTELVSVEVSDCHYNGLPQYPDVTVTYNGGGIPQSEYTLLLSDNTEVSVGDKSAECIINFRGSCYGERTAEFKILKAAAQDMEIDLAAKAGQSFSIDLTELKPDGASFGGLVFNSDEYEANAQPKIAFNVLSFTLKSTLNHGAMIGVPVDMPVGSEYEDYWLEFFITITDKPVPVLALNPVIKKYDGKPVTSGELASNGSMAFVDGSVVSGEWSFTTDVPVKPCSKQWAVAKFTPDDEQYSVAYGLVPITIARRELEDFIVKTNSKALDYGELLELTVNGIPDDFDGTFTITEKNNRPFDILSDYTTDNGRFIDIELAEYDKVYSIVLSLEGSAVYASFSKEIKVSIGIPDEVIEDTPTTQEELSQLIANAADLSVVRVNKLSSVSADLLRKAAAKKLIIENEINDVLAIVIEPAVMTSVQSLDLTVNRAVIPPVLLEELGDEEIYSFTSFAKATDGISVKLQPDSDTGYSFVCLYRYNTNGELERLYTVARSGGTVKFALPSSGKFCVTASDYSHIKCDVNNDGKFTTADLMKSLEIFVSISGKPDKEQLALVDFDKDGAIGISDLTYILEYFTSV